jgi:anti-anti-sigma factor
MSLQLSVTTQNGWKVIHVGGQVDSKTVGELRDFLDQEVQAGSGIALDLSQVPFMSSAGLRTLLTLHRMTKGLGLALSLVGIQPQIEDTMKVTGFYQYFTIHPSLSSLPSSPS